MTTTALDPTDPRAVALVTVIRAGDVAGLRRLLADDPVLARTPVGTDVEARPPLHLVTDHPGHLPGAAGSIQALVAAGADVDARFVGTHEETALHWAASADDVVALDALVAAGADLEATGGVIADGTPLADAVAFGQWAAARRLVEHGAATTLWQAAALGLEDRVREGVDAASPEAVTNALWHAANGGQARTAALLLDAGGDPGWEGYDGLTPVDAARRAGADDVVTLLTGKG